VISSAAPRLTEPITRNRWFSSCEIRDRGSFFKVAKQEDAHGTAPWTVPGKPVISEWIRSAGMPSPKLIGPHATLVKVYMLIDSRYASILGPDPKKVEHKMSIERLLVFRNVYILSTRSIIKCHLRARLNVPFFIQESCMKKKRMCVNMCEKNFCSVEWDLKFTSE